MAAILAVTGAKPSLGKPGEVLVTFDRAVAPASALDLANYAFAPSFVPKSAFLSVDAKTVTLRNCILNLHPWNEDLRSWSARFAGTYLPRASMAPYGRLADGITATASNPRYAYQAAIAPPRYVLGQTYNFSAYIWTDTGTKTARLTYQWKDGNTWVVAWSSALTITTTPTRFSGSFTTPTTSGDLRLFVGLGTFDSVTYTPTDGIYYLGGLQLTEGPNLYNYAGLAGDAGSVGEQENGLAPGTEYEVTVSNVIAVDGSTLNPAADSALLRASSVEAPLADYGLRGGPFAPRPIWTGSVFARVLEKLAPVSKAAAPYVRNVVPVSGQTVTATTRVALEVVAPAGASAATLRRVVLVAHYPKLNLWEVVHDGVLFAPAYSRMSTIAAVVGEGLSGFGYDLLRDGGWPESPALVPYAVNTEGTENA